MVANRQEIAASFADASNERPSPVNNNNKNKAIIKDYKTLSDESKGKIEFKKSQIKIYPEYKVHGAPAQPMIGEHTKMTFLTSLFPEKTEYLLSESEVSFLEIMAHKHDVDINDLYEIFMEGVEYWETVDDEYRTPEEYGYYFVNEAVQELEEKRGRWLPDFRDDEQKNTDAARKIAHTEYLRKQRYDAGKQRSVGGYSPEIAPAEETKGKPVFRYRIKVIENPHLDDGKTGEYKVRAENPLDAVEQAYRMHEMFGGTERKPHWDHEIYIDRSPIGSTGGKIASRKNRRIKKPKTTPGKVYHWFGQVDKERSNAPKGKRKRKGSGGGGRRRSSVPREPLPASRQLVHHPEPYQDD